MVLWSEASVSSKWVDIEAREGEKRGVLLPALLDQLTEDQLPFGLHQIQATDLRDWDGKSSHRNLDLLLHTIDAKLGQEATAPSGPVAIAAPGDTFRDRLEDGSEGPEMVVIPAGVFQMGDIQGSAMDDEKPVHEVDIAKPFAMGKYPVTFEDYDRFAKATGRKLPSDEDWGRGNRPVINVSWEDAVVYTEWLSAQTGKRYRLPTEAEWEYAARAGTETEYWWGNEMDPNMANCEETGSKWGGKQTAPVGSFPANPFGLHDTTGNVWEWIQDCGHDTYNNAPADGTAWGKEDGGDCARRVIRGGSWSDKPRVAGSAIRGWGAPDNRNDSVGFRLAQDID